MTEVLEKKDSMTQLAELLNRARKCSNKGRYYVYEGFKSELQRMELSPDQYEETCRLLAKYLRV